MREVAGLLALMLLTDARRAARTGPNGELIPLDEQDRTLWDRQAIAEGVALVERRVVERIRRRVSAAGGDRSVARRGAARRRHRLAADPRAVRRAATDVRQSDGRAQSRDRDGDGRRSARGTGAARSARRRTSGSRAVIGWSRCARTCWSVPASAQAAIALYRDAAAQNDEHSGAQLSADARGAAQRELVMQSGFELPISIPPRNSRERLRSLHRQLRTAILEGRLQPGLRLPPTRVLAAEYGVSRNTAVAAYDLLLSEGYLTSRRGAGTYVADVLPKPPARRNAPAAKSVADRRLNAVWLQPAMPFDAERASHALSFQRWRAGHQPLSCRRLAALVSARSARVRQDHPPTTICLTADPHCVRRSRVMSRSRARWRAAPTM